MRWVPFAVAVAGLGALVLHTFDTVTGLGYYNRSTPTPWREAAILAWALSLVAVAALALGPRRLGATVVIAGSVLLSGAALAGPPNTSTDSARYAWDGIVQTNGVSPYAYAPADPALEHLRTGWLFPTPALDDEGEEFCPGIRNLRSEELGTGEVLCTTINRAQVPTIYPPAAQLAFAAVRAVVGPEPQYAPFQVVGAAASVGTTVLLIVALRRLGRDPRWAALWGWNPLVAAEAVTNSHIDILGVLPAVAGLLVVTVPMLSRRRAIVGAALAGVGVAVKFLPALIGPAVLRRRPTTITLTVLATVALLYVPYVLVTGTDVLGYLPGYLSEEGFESGDRFALLSLILPAALGMPAAVLILLATAVLVIRRTDPSDPWLGATVMTGVALLVLTPRYPWYALLLVAVLVVARRPEWLGVAAALAVRGYTSDLALFRTNLLLGAALVVVVLVVRRSGPAIRERVRNLRERQVLRTLPDGAPNP